MTTTYREAAKAKFNLLKEALESKSDLSFWHVAQTFDTLIDYLANVDHSEADHVADLVVEQYKDNFKGHTYNEIWFDDYGWWIVATFRAGEKDFFSPKAKDQFRAIMLDCWKHFTENAPKVWERRGPDSEFGKYRPSIAGGVWNEYWDGTDAKWTGPKDGNPSQPNLHGVQNTVTNVLYLISAVRLSADKDPRVAAEAKEAAKNEYTFLYDWILGATWLKPPTLWWGV